MKAFEPNKTITELGIDTTRKFVVVYFNPIFEKGEILTLAEDDDTTSPSFKNENGEIAFMSLKNLAYYEEEEMKEGDLVYVNNMSEEDAFNHLKKRILLRKCNDGVVCVAKSWETEYKDGKAFMTIIWNFAVPIPKTKRITLDMTDEQEIEINNIINK